MEAILTNIVAAVNDVLWNKYLVLLFLLLGSGIYFTIRTGFVQVRKFGEIYGVIALVCIVLVPSRRSPWYGICLICSTA